VICGEILERVKISVIIPTLNEAEHLAEVLEALAVESKGPHEVIVVDGGSDDGTESIAGEGGARIIACSTAGRACQMNCGAAEAQGEVLFFLHGDTLVPEDALNLIDEALANSEVVGGGFIRRFDSDSWWLNLTCRLADWRSERWGIFLGDHGMFVRSEDFEELGGFDENLLRCEDLDFSLNMREQGKVVALRPAVVSSARRFDELGPFRTTLRDAWWTVKYLFGR